MRLANLKGRAVMLDGQRAIDVEQASQGRFPSSTRAILQEWAEFRAWADTADLTSAAPFNEADLDAPVTDPKQIFAIGLNYSDHAREASLPEPDHLVVFTKFASSLAGPNASVALSSESVDYETELVIVIGEEGHRINESDAWQHVAGLSVGQDISDRALQLRGPAPQFSLGKSFPGFGPFGPAIVTPDELPNPNALAIGATLEGRDLAEPQVLQEGNTEDLIFPVATIISELSQVVTLFPGDLIFTGTPAGVGGPQGRFLKPGQVLVSTVEGIGTLRNPLT